MEVGGPRHAPGRFTPGKGTRYPQYRRLSRREGKISLPPGLDPRTAQPDPSRYTDLAIPAHTPASYLALHSDQELRIKTSHFA
jgi:hypothetical protein